MKITLDIKSLIFGFMAAGLVILALSFKSSQNGDSGKFRTVMDGEKVIILDSETGAYIIAPYMREVGKVQWIKGDFQSTYQSGRDNKRQD